MKKGKESYSKYISTMTFIQFNAIQFHICRSRRRRKTEKEEDEEILKDEQDETDDHMTVFTQSPACM